jgi:predicted MFS family arabinose efflux permease
MLTTYRDVLRLPGAASMSAAGYVARQPLSMVALGIVIYISGISGSFAEAGLLAAAFQVPAALCALVTSRWMDRYGQRRILPLLALVHAALLIAFILTVQSSQPFAVQIVVAALVGATQPSIGALVRTRWAFVIRRDGRPGQLRAAFALESLVDELVFTIGPLLVTFLAVSLALWSPLALAAILLLVGSLLLSAMSRTAPPATGRPTEHTVTRAVIREPGMLIAFVAAIGLGFVFGAYEVSVVAFATQAGQPAASGLILALWAFGSLLGGLWFGARHWRMHLPTQAMLCLIILTIVLLPVPFIRSIPVLAIATLLGGAAVAPALISGFSLAERLVPPARLTEGLTWATSGLALGVSGGAAIGGAVIDGYGTAWAFVLPVIGAGLAAIAIASRRTRLITAVRPYAPQGADEGVVVATPDPVPGPGPGAVSDDAP